MVARATKLYGDALKKMMPKVDLAGMTDMYKKNLEYVGAMNNVLTDLTKTLYHVYMDFIKELEARSGKVFTEALDGDNASTMQNMNDALKECSDLSSKCTGAASEAMKKAGKGAVDLTKGYTKEALKKAMEKNPVVNILKKSASAAKSKSSSRARV